MYINNYFAYSVTDCHRNNLNLYTLEDLKWDKL